jgi:hypothetical protein
MPRVLLLVVAGLLAAQASPAAARPSRVGVMLDLGVPDGANVSLVVRPARFVELHAGGGTNLVSPGVRAGAVLHLLPTAVSPTLSAEVGRYFPGDGNAALIRLGLAAESDEPVLREVGYDYGNLHLGVHAGRGRVAVFLHAGYSVIRGELRQVEASFVAAGLGHQVPEDPTFTIITPSARLGLAVFL